MKALFVSNDPSLFDRASAGYARMQEYAAAIGTLHIVSRAQAPEDTTEGPLTLHGVTGPNRLAQLRAVEAKVKELIASESIEVVSAQDPFEHGRIAYRATRGTPAKLHIQVHTDFLSAWFVRGAIFRSPSVLMPAKNQLRVQLAGHVLAKADGIRVVSERIRQSLLKRYGQKIVDPVVIPIAVSTTLPTPIPLPEHPFPFALVTVGRLEPEKRIEDILQALALIHDRYPAVGLIVIGDGRERPALEQMVKDQGLEGCVIFAGEQPNAWGLVRSAQAYIQASGYEGYGRTLIEAALARVPIITTDVGVVGEVLSGFEDVLATPPGDPTNLSYHIIALLEDRPSTELRIRSAEAKALAHLAKYQNLPALIASDLSRLVNGSKPV